MNTPHVVIFGAGFGGLNVAHQLRNTPVQITLIDKQNYHLFQPLLYQVAISWVAGWTAHIFEQRQQSRIIRPESQLVGPRDRRWVSLDEQWPIIQITACQYHSNMINTKNKGKAFRPFTRGYKIMVMNRDVVKSGTSQQKANDIHEGKWNGLGGKFEAGETPEECVIREVLEESGLSMQNPKLCGVLMFPKFKGNDWYVFVITATEFNGELIDSPEGKLEWIPDEKVLDLNLWESDHLFMPWIREEKFFSAKFEYEGDTMCGYHVVFHS